MARRGPSVLLLAALLLTLAGTASAQQLSRGLFQAEPVGVPSLTLPPADTGKRRDFRWLGTAIGAVGLGLAGGLEGRAYCGNFENGPRDCTSVTLGWGLAGAAVGGVMGHLVGRAIHR